MTSPSSPSDAGPEPGSDRTVVRETSLRLFHELHDPTTGDTRRRACRDELVALHLPLVDHCARRFARRGESLEDLVQVGTIGLIKAVDRFAVERGFEFSTYATPTVIGEIKRHFRDRGGAIRVPRRLQEMRRQIDEATAALSQELGRAPTAREIAAHVDQPVEDVIDGLEAANAYSPLSLDVAGDRSADGGALQELLGAEDEELEHVELRSALRPTLERLPAREKQILLLRFFRGMTQSQIAVEVGISQMHVSRLLSRTLEDLRSALADEG